MATSAPTLLSDLRARRLARRAIEAQERLDAAAHGLAASGDGELEALRDHRDRTVARLERAAALLPGSMSLRACIDEACRAHRALVSSGPGDGRARTCADRFAAALDALADAMRRGSEPRAARRLQ